MSASRQKIFLWCLLGMLSAGILLRFGVHLEYSSDTTFPLFYRGVLNGVVVKSTYIYELYWGELFSRAYAWRSEWPFHGVALMLFSIVALILSIIPIIRFQTPLLWTAIMTVSLTGLLLVHVIWLDFTRIPLVIGAAVPLLFLATHTTVWSTVILIIIWVTAYWLRPESGQVAIIMTLPSFLFALLTDFNRYKRAALLSLMGAILAIGSSLAHRNFHREEDAYAMRRMYDLHFAFFDAYHRNATMANSSPANEARYNAMMVDFQSDKDSLSMDHYASFVDGKAFTKDAFKQFPERMVRLGEFLQLLGGRDKGLVLFYLSVIIGCAILLGQRRKIMHLLWHQLYCWGSILAIVFFVKAAERTYEPMIAVAALIAFADLRRMYSGYYPFILKMGMYPLLVVFLYAGYHWANTYKEKSQWYKEMRRLNRKHLIEVVDWQRKHGNIILTVDAMELFNTGPLHEFHESQLFFNMHDAHINYFPGMNEALFKQFAAASLIDFYRLAAENGSLLISTEQRMSVIQNYLKEVHKLHIQGSAMHSLLIQRVSGEVDHLQVYQLSKSAN
jgi:hypothetical protein